MSLEERARRAAESLLENSSLTADLFDPEAQVLLDWGMKLATNLARDTGGVDDGQAEPILDAGLSDVRRVMRRVNRLVGHISEHDTQAVHKRLLSILETAERMPILKVNYPADLDAEVETLRGLSQGEALNRMLTWLGVGVDDEL